MKIATVILLFVSASAFAANGSLYDRFSKAKNKAIFAENLAKRFFPNPGHVTNGTRYPNDPPFEPTPECGDYFGNLTIGSYGQITSPNYPENYTPNLRCEWTFESVPGTVVEATFFDVVTQPWTITFIDYVMVSRDGTWDEYRRFSGDVNHKMPFTFISNGTKLGVRFVSSAWLNFRGFKLSYLVRPAKTSDKYPPENEQGSAFNNDLTAVCDNIPIPNPENLPTRDNKKPLSKPSKIVTKGNNTVHVLIVNGVETVPHDYPFMVAILIDDYFFCGGSLIDEYHVLTSANCVELAEKIDMFFGVHNMSNNDENLYARQVRTVDFPHTSTHVFQHPNYDSDTAAHDIAIVKLPEKIDITAFVQPVYLPSKYTSSNIFTSWTLKTLGWGETRKYQNETRVSPVLRQANAFVLPNVDCQDTFFGLVTGNFICTQTVVPSSTTPEPTESEYEEDPDSESEVEIEYESPCHGDSGSPLIASFEPPTGSDGEANQAGPSNHMCVKSKSINPTKDVADGTCDEESKWYVQVGIVSFGDRVCGRETPVMYTRLTAYLEWISQITGRLG